MILRNEDEMISFGRRLGQRLTPHTVILLNGELGAGKTTLTKGIGQGLSVTKVINSPTFTILKTYQGRLTLNHFDAYRLEGTDDDLGFEEIFDDEGVSVIEWPGFIADIIPAEHLTINIMKNDDQTRSLEFKARGEKYQKLLEELGL